MTNLPRATKFIISLIITDFAYAYDSVSWHTFYTYTDLWHPSLSYTVIVAHLLIPFDVTLQSCNNTQLLYHNTSYYSVLEIPMIP